VQTSARIRALQSRLFAKQSFVCGGHGARWPSHAEFTVPAGITIYFYVPDGVGLGNDIGQRVDRVVLGEAPPPATATFTAGQRCWNYHLFSSRAGGYLNLGMSTDANDHYITTPDKDVGIGLEEIVGLIVGKCPAADIHWSACRSIESGTDTFGWSKPKYRGALAKLAAAK